MQDQTAAESAVIEALKFALVKGWSLSKVKESETPPMRQKTVCMRRPVKKKRSSHGQRREKEVVLEPEEAFFYEPNVPDLSKVGMGVEHSVSYIPAHRFQNHCHCTLLVCRPWQKGWQRMRTICGPDSSRTNKVTSFVACCQSTN